MYEAHFGLRARPFGETVDPGAYIAVPSREAALRRLRYGLEYGRGPVLAYGPPGAGKTLLARKLATELGGPMIHLAFSAMPAADLLAHLADELALSGLVSGGSGIASSVRRIRAALRASSARGLTPVVIVDEAHLIDDPATYEALRLLLNSTTGGEPELSLVLVGGTELMLRLPLGLGDRLMARCLIGALSESESRTYIEQRLARAGASAPLFEPSALEVLHRSASGLPRRLNRLADMALLIASSREQRQVDVNAVSIAAREAA